jgi:hypothetical protein
MLSNVERISPSAIVGKNKAITSEILRGISTVVLMQQEITFFYTIILYFRKKRQKALLGSDRCKRPMRYKQRTSTVAVAATASWGAAIAASADDTALLLLEP